MDLAFTPEEQAFREEIHAWVQANLPADISHKVHNALRLSRDDMQRWAKILGKKGWLGYGWPKQFGGPGWNAIQKHLFEEELAMAGAPRIVPFGPVMVAPVIMAFGSPELQKKHLQLRRPEGHDDGRDHHGAERHDAWRAGHRELFLEQVLLDRVPARPAELLGPAVAEPAFLAEDLGPALHIVARQPQRVVHLVA